MSSTLIDDLRIAYHARTRTSYRIRMYRRAVIIQTATTLGYIVGGIVLVILVTRGIGTFL